MPEPTEPSTSRLVVPSRWRAGLAGTTDYLLFAAVYSALVWPFGSATLHGLALRVISFVVVEGAMFQLGRTTPGMALAGFQRVHAGLSVSVPRGETRWTLAVAIVLLYSGSACVVRMTDPVLSPPLFGLLVPEPLATVLEVARGISELVAGALVLRGRAVGPWIALPGTLASVLALVVDPERVRAFVEVMVVARRTSQGLSVRPGEVAWMQAVYPRAGVALGAVFAIVLVVTAFRLRPRN